MFCSRHRGLLKLVQHNYDIVIETAGVFLPDIPHIWSDRQLENDIHSNLNTVVENNKNILVLSILLLLQFCIQTQNKLLFYHLFIL